MDILYLIKGIMIGIIFGVPAGAIGALTIKHSLEDDVYAGILTGLGSSIADVVYACIGLFGISMVEEFLDINKSILRFIGGVFILVYGITMICQKVNIEQQSIPKKTYVSYIIQSFLISIVNPVTITTFFVAFTSFDIRMNVVIINKIMLLCGLLIGTMTWWTLLSYGTYHLRNKLIKKIPIIHKGIGAVLILLAMFMMFLN